MNLYSRRILYSFLAAVIANVLDLSFSVNGENTGFSFPNNQRPLNKNSAIKEPIICYDLWDPVCATDGKTYGNACELNRAKQADPYIFGVCKGACPCCSPPFYNEPLPHEHTGFWGDRPVGQVLNPPAARLGWQPEENETDYCKEKAENPSCSYIALYAPVCGSDGNTYSNSGELGCQQQMRPCLRQACEGGCPCCSCLGGKASNLNSTRIPA